MEPGHWKRYWRKTRTYDANGLPKEKPAGKAPKAAAKSLRLASGEGAAFASSNGNGDGSTNGSAAPSRATTPEPAAGPPTAADDEAGEKRKKGRAKTLRITELPPQKIESDLKKMLHLM